jgi:hypothetical protein
MEKTVQFNQLPLLIMMFGDIIYFKGKVNDFLLK